MGNIGIENHEPRDFMIDPPEMRSAEPEKEKSNFKEFFEMLGAFFLKLFEIFFIVLVAHIVFSFFAVALFFIIAWIS